MGLLNGQSYHSIVKSTAIVKTERIELFMAYEEKKVGTARQHNVIMENRRRLSVSGVEEVDSFDDTEIVAVSSGGNLIIRGSELHIDKLDLEGGELNVTGLISELCYEEVSKGKSLWTRLFK